MTYPKIPTKRMIEAGIAAAENCLDHDWDSGCDGEGYNSYTTLRSDAPSIIWKAMCEAYDKEISG